MRWLLFNPRYSDAPEKDKRKEMPARLSWMHSRYYIYVVCALFFITGLVHIFELPEVTGQAVKPAYFLAMGLTGLILGFSVAAVFALLHSLLTVISLDAYTLYLIPSAGERLTMVLALAAMTLILDILVRQLQILRGFFKWAVYLNYVIPVLILCSHLWTTLSFDVVPEYTPSEITCEYFLTDTTGIRAVHHWHNPHEYKYDLTEYSVTRDGGQTWSVFALATTIEKSDCPNGTPMTHFSTFNDLFFWLWQGQDAVVTRDGGSTWTRWHLNQRGDGYECYIQGIAFTDEQHGTIDCYYIEFSGMLETDDGGITWHEVAR